MSNASPKRRSSGAIDRRRPARIQTALIAWYGEHARDLPWRRTRDPYAVLVSEIMLQQIQVSRATPFYLAFMDRFPTIQSLAAAPRSDVIRVWGDLGRYRRITDLHSTARRIVQDFAGSVPSDVATLRTLPGIGPYTAGAVACFAFEQDVAFLDTNARRVIHRLFVGSDVPKPTVSIAELQAMAERAVPAGRGWLWNQAVIEFGALLCSARRPACDRCPLRRSCRAYPQIATDLAERPRAVAGSASSYLGTNRYYRGRVLAHLRDAQGEVELRALGERLRPGYTDADLPWIAGVVETLRKDGLASVEETGPAYDPGSPPAEATCSGRRVRLPD